MISLKSKKICASFGFLQRSSKFPLAFSFSTSTDFLTTIFGGLFLATKNFTFSMRKKPRFLLAKYIFKKFLMLIMLLSCFSSWAAKGAFTHTKSVLSRRYA